MIFFYPSIFWQGVCKHLVNNAPSVGIVRCSKNPVDAREKTSNRGRNLLVWPAPKCLSVCHVTSLTSLHSAYPHGAHANLIPRAFSRSRTMLCRGVRQLGKTREKLPREHGTNISAECVIASDFACVDIDGALFSSKSGSC